MQWSLMTAISAIFFVCFFRLNYWLFGWLEYTHGVNWVFLPAGFRVMLVLALGIPGALGIALGTLWIDAGAALPPAMDLMFMTCLASGFTPWLVKAWMERRGTLGRLLEHLTSHALVQFVLVYAVLNAIAHQSIRWFFDPNAHGIAANLWPMFVGDALGAFILLYAMKMALSRFGLPTRGER